MDTRYSLIEESLEQRRLIKTCVPLRFIGKTLEMYEAKTDAQKNALDISRDYVKRFSEHRKVGRCLVMSGSVGAGKTHLACAIAQELREVRLSEIRIGWDVRYTTVSDLIREIRSTWGKGAGSSEADAIGNFVKPDLLIIDEIGVQMGSDAERVQLSELIDLRYRQILPTLVITNCDRKTPERLIGERRFDRLRENGGIMCVFNWPSYRSAA
jgi:DNA replication protein DnaC